MSRQYFRPNVAKATPEIEPDIVERKLASLTKGLCDLMCTLGVPAHENVLLNSPYRNPSDDLPAKNERITNGEVAQRLARILRDIYALVMPCNFCGNEFSKLRQLREHVAHLPLKDFPLTDTRKDTLTKVAACVLAAQVSVQANFEPIASH